MEDFPLFGEVDFGDFGDGLLADMSPAGMDDAGGMFELDQLYQNWLADGNEGSFAEFKNTLDNASNSSSDSDASGGVTGLDAGGSLTDGLKAFEGDGLLSPKPMIELSRPEAAPAPPPVSARGFASEVPAISSRAAAFAPLFQEKEERFGLPSGYLTKTAEIESRFNPNAQNPNSSAGGLFQFINSTARQYNLEDRFDPYQATDAAARLAKDNADTLRSGLGREPTAGELYLAHQQGAGGALNLLRNPDQPAESVVGRAAARLNAGAGLTAGQFANRWTSKFDGLPAVTPGPGAQQASLSNADPRPYRGQLNSIPSDGIEMIYGPYRGPSGEIGEIRGPYRGELNGIPSDELVRPIPYRRQLNDIPSNELVRPAAVRPVEGDIANANQLEADARYYDRTNPEAAAQLRARAAMARGGNGQAQSGNAGMPAPGAQPDLRMAGIGAVPVNPNGFAPARLPKLEPNATPMGPGTYAVTPAELTGDSAGLLSPNMAIPGNVSNSNSPTIPGGIAPGYIYQDAVRTLPAQAPPPPPAPPGARPNTSRTQVAGDPPPNARSKNPPASSAVETRGRSMTPQNQVPPEYFTADTGGSGMGAMRFMEGEFARREGQQPPTFGGIGAAISNGMSGVSQAINSAISGAPPPPPVGVAPVQAAVSTAPAGQASGRAAQQAQATGGPPSWYTPQMDAFLGGLSSALMSGNASAFTPAYEAILASAQNRAKTAGDQAAIAHVLMKNGLPAEEAALLARSSEASKLMMSTLEKQQERARDEAFNQRAAAIGSPTPSAPTASPAPTGQAPTAQPVANRPPAPSALEAERQRLVKMSEQYATLFSQAPSDRARQNLQFQINRVDAQIKSIDEAKKAGVPAGFQRNPDGGIVPIPGGPQDPNFLRERKRIEAEGENLKPPSGYVYKNNVLEPIKGGPAEKIDGEIAGRIGLAKSWLENDAKVIEKRIDDGVFKGLGNTAAMVAAGAIEGVNVFGGRGHSGGFLSGEASETFRKLQSGTEVLTRLMTGAGMNIQEARQYAERYLPGALDTNANIKSKFQQLQREITDVAKVASLGRGNLIATDAGQQPPPPSSGQGAASASDPLEGRQARNLETKERIIRRNGKWEPMP
jgi:hypothetical protein